MACNKKLRVLDLFSGIGGFSLGLERTGGFETIAFCEYEDFPRRVLAKHWPDVTCFPDVRELKGADIDGPVDVICGGYPCQPFSTAGQRRGKEDDRHLWPEFNRLVAELRPSWVIGENVAGHISMGLDDVLSDLEGQGYACRSFVIPACAVDAPHRRDRIWTVAHTDSQRLEAMRGEREDSSRKGYGGRAQRVGGRADAQRQVSDGSAGQDTGLFSDVHWTGQRPDGGAIRTQRGNNARVCGEILADPNHAGPQGRAKAGYLRGERARRDKQPERRPDLPGAAWNPEPAVGRVAYGISGRVDRLKALGNAVVPQIPELIGRAILEADGVAA